MAEKVEIDLDVISNLEPTIANLKILKKQLKETAAGSAEFNKLSASIRDMDDSIKDASAGADDFAGFLEGASGPLGVFGKGLRSAEKSFSSFNAILKTSIIGILVAAIGGLVAAFSQSEVAMKKLEPLFIAFEKILGGIFRALEPVLDSFIEMAGNVLPYVTKGIGVFYSALVALFTYIQQAGTGVFKFWKGLLTLDFDTVSEGVTQIAGSFKKTADAYTDTMKKFEEGTKEQTKTEKENAEARKKIADEEAKKKKEAADKAAAEAEKIRQENLRKNEAADAVELEAFKATLSERERAEFEAGLKLAEQRKILAAAGRTDMTAIENEYRLALAAIKKKADDEEAKITEEKNKKDADALKKKLEDERSIILSSLQTSLEDLDRENAMSDFDFAQDLERLAKQKDILAEQEKTELQNTELTEFQKTEIRKKFADARRKVSDQEVTTERAAAQAKHEINMQQLQLVEQFGNTLSQLAGKNKTLAIAGIVVSQAAAIGQIIAKTAQANATAVGASPLTFGMPWVALNTISAGLSIASTIKSAMNSIKEIRATPGAAAQGGGNVGSAPQLATPRASGMPTPQIQTQGGASASSQIAQTMAASQQRPLRAYVVSQDISSNQALDRRTNRAATFSGG